DRSAARRPRHPVESSRRAARRGRTRTTPLPRALQHRTRVLMRATRRLLKIVALAGTLIVGIAAVALIVSQTPWFKDWLRRYIVRESKQYLNGELTIGQLGGNLFFGVQLSDLAVNLSG